MKHFKVRFSFYLLGEHAHLKTLSFKISNILQSILNFSSDTLDSLVQVSYAQNKSACTCVSLNSPHFTQKAYIYSIHISICALTPKKCKILAFDFLHYISFQFPPVATCGCILEEVKSFKFLGVFIFHDLTWMVHCDYIMKKAYRKLYALRQLRQCGVSAHDSVMVYCLLVRSILEYACVVFAALPQYLSDSLERIQKRALAIIFPGSTYSEASNLTTITILEGRRSAASHEFIAQLNPDNPVYKQIASRLESTSASTHHSLRSRDRARTKITATNRFGDFVTNKYATDPT